MKVTLIEPPIMDRFNGRLKPIAMDAVRECPPYGIYMLASVLRQAGHEVILVDLIAQGSRSMQRYYRDLEDCGLVGIGATSMSWATARDVIKEVRRVRNDVPIVLGGIHPTMFDQYLLRNFPVQFIVRGEAEIGLMALCEALEGKIEISEVPNLSWRTLEGQIIRNPLGPKIPGDKLGSFALPDYSTLSQNVYKGLAIESSRGCAFDCSFCSTSYRKSWRGIPAEQFVDRLEVVMQHVDRTEHQTVHIIDDEFSMDPRRATEIARIIRRRGLHPRLVYDSRAKDLLWDGYVENIAEFTCQFLVGAECGYDEGLKLIGKGTTCKLLEDSARILYKYGISGRADFSFILGLPWETRSEIEKTIQFAMHLFGNYGVRVLLQWYCQIPGSRLWEEDRRNALVNETMYNNYGFFQDLYLFRTGVRHVTPKEIWEIADMVLQLQILASLRYPRKKMVEHALPAPIAQHYPRELFLPQDTGLASLREVSKPALQVGIPLRHFVDVAKETTPSTLQKGGD